MRRNEVKGSNGRRKLLNEMNEGRVLHFPFFFLLMKMIFWMVFLFSAT